jgi:hypothetical protein
MIWIDTKTGQGFSGKRRENPGCPGNFYPETKIPWATLKTNRPVRYSPGIPVKNVHGSKIPWATLRTNGKTWKSSGKPGKIDHDSKTPWAILKINRQAWKSSGKPVKFLEIAGNLKKSLRKFRNRRNFSEGFKNFQDIDNKNFEIERKFLEVFKILNSPLRKKRNHRNFFRNAENSFETGKKFKVIVKIFGSFFRESRNHWNNTNFCMNINKSLNIFGNRCESIGNPGKDGELPELS